MGPSGYTDWVLQRVLTFMGILGLMAGCGPHLPRSELAASPHLQITGIEIHNALPYIVHDVTILVPVSGDYVSCGQILPDSSCSTSFPVRDYRETAVQISWKEHGEPQSTAPFILKAPIDANNGEQAYIRVEVFGKGQAGAELLLLDAETR